MKKLGIRPRRTVRIVLWTNEENGLRGATAYAARYAAHAGEPRVRARVRFRCLRAGQLGFYRQRRGPERRCATSASLLTPLGLSEIVAGGGGADIGPIAQAGNAPTMAYLGDPARYFVIHHTAADTVERIAPQEVSKAAAAIAVMAYVIAEMPERLPR